MIGKVKVTSTGYDPDGPRVFDPTLGVNPEGAAKVTKDISLIPVCRRVLVCPVDSGEGFDLGAVHIPRGTLAKELRLCAVLAVGPKVKDKFPQLVAGIPVYLKPFFGTEVIVNGTAVLFVFPEDIQGVARFRE